MKHLLLIVATVSKNVINKQSKLRMKFRSVKNKLNNKWTFRSIAQTVGPKVAICQW